jgi:hypothetical protein
MCCTHRRPGGFFRGIVTVAGLLGLGWVVTSSGCIHQTQRFWAESQELQQVPAQGVKSLNIKTQNGAVRVRPALMEDQIQVFAHVKVGGRDQQDADEGLAAVEIVLDQTVEAGRLDIGWRHRRPSMPHWQTQVSFEVFAPAEVDVEVETLNGEIDLAAVEGECNLSTHNGEIRALALSTGRFEADSHNGSITVSTPAEDVLLRTTNGEIRASLESATSLSGEINTVNGEVVVQLAERPNTEIQCSVTNGRIVNELTEDAATRRDRRHLNLKFGDGDDELKIVARNGSIKLRPATEEH